MANVSSSNGLEKRPKLRFPGFDEPYGSTRLGDIAALVNRTDPKSNAPIMMLSAGNGFIMQSEKYSRDNAGQSLKKYILLKQGELAYNHGASKAKQFGCCYELTEPEARIPYVYHCFKINNHEYTPFIAMALNNPKMDKQLKRLVSSSVRMDGLLNISFEDYMSVTIHLPSPSEQKHIADFLQKIDERIAAQENLLASLKKYKRGAIKSIFTQRVSFHAEKNKWESHKMSELITLQSGQDFAPTDYNEQGKGIPYMTGASCIVEGQTVVSRWTTVPRCFAYRGDTLLVCKGSGSGAVAFLSQDKVHIARQFMALRPHGGMTKEFCFYLTLHLSEKMKQSATGLIEGIDRKTVLNQRVFLPPIVEQERIVKFLSAIEKALITQEGVLKSLVSIKKGLMQQLFI
ncbi:restriction endonuclease subunit S [Clostridiaceae bacterium Marseille-Q4145]|nr:restriction endonuclease subunit S [Clostridiaceae bacterium Marseille-Q4145]